MSNVDDGPVGIGTRAEDMVVPKILGYCDHVGAPRDVLED